MDQVMVARLLGQAAFKAGKVEALTEVLDLLRAGPNENGAAFEVEGMRQSAIEELNVTLGTVNAEVGA